MHFPCRMGRTSEPPQHRASRNSSRLTQCQAGWIPLVSGSTTALGRSCLFSSDLDIHRARSQPAETQEVNPYLRRIVPMFRRIRWVVSVNSQAEAITTFVSDTQEANRR